MSWAWTPPYDRAMTCTRFARAALIVAVLVAPSACADDNAEPARQPPAPSASDVSTQPAEVVASPATARPGDNVELLFPDDIERGSPWFMYEPDGDQWSQEPLYLLISANDDYYDCNECPTWFRAGTEGSGWDDVGIAGPGPDTIVIPEAAAVGDYRLCAANTGDEICFTLSVSEA